MKLAICIILMAMVLAGPALADRVIFAPTGTVLGGGEIRVEGAVRASDSDTKVFWAGLGLQRIEISGIRFENGAGTVSGGEADVINGELGILPETTLTPGVGVGVWDATDKTADGTGYFLALTKQVPLTGQIPSPIRDIRLHIGVGFAGLDGLFAGAEAKLPLGLKVYAERFQGDFNVALGWSPLPAIQLKVYSLDGDTFYGLQISPPL